MDVPYNISFRSNSTPKNNRTADNFISIHFFKNSEMMSLLDLIPKNQNKGHQGEFLLFHSRNPHIYKKLVSYARYVRKKGISRIGMRLLFERVRWDYTIETNRKNEKFKINNNYAPYYARMIMENNPDLDGLFELRKIK